MSEITPELIFHELRERTYSGKETRKVTLLQNLNTATAIEEAEEGYILIHQATTDFPGEPRDYHQVMVGITEEAHAQALIEALFRTFPALKKNYQ